VGYRHGGEPRLACPGPHLLFILALRDGGPHAIDLAVRPRSGRVTDSGSVVGPIRDRDQVYILPFDLLLTYLLLTSDFIQISTLSMPRLNSYYCWINSHNILFRLKQNPTIWPLLSRNHRLSRKPMPAKCSLNTLGGKPFVSGSANIFFVLKYSRLIV
jgi:hypothetical protein